MKNVDHYLNAIKRNVLQGTSRTSIEMSVRDEETIMRLREDVVPTETLSKLGKKQLAEVNARFDQFKKWVGEAQGVISGYSVGGIEDTDKEVMLADLDELLSEVKSGTITTEPYQLLMSYLSLGVPHHVREGNTEGVLDYMSASGGVSRELLAEACQYNVRCKNALGEVSEVGQLVTPFPVTYMVYAEITEADLIGNAERAPASANRIRNMLSRDFEKELMNSTMTMNQKMSLYRIVGPERIQPKAAVEITNVDQSTQQQIVIVKDAAKMKPQNLVVNDNAELLGVGAAYGNMDKSGLLKLASGESQSEGVTVNMR